MFKEKEIEIKYVKKGSWFTKGGGGQKIKYQEQKKKKKKRDFHYQRYDVQILHQHQDQEFHLQVHVNPSNQCTSSLATDLHQAYQKMLDLFFFVFQPMFYYYRANASNLFHLYIFVFHYSSPPQLMVVMMWHRHKHEVYEQKRKIVGG